jgi:uncharacterized protein DUF262
MNTADDDSLFDFGHADEQTDGQIDEYDLTATPNDFNVLTINSFIESGAVKIPGFQRNYVWDIKRASKLIESLIIGLPVPQVFLYEESRNSFLVIDGQQRLMTIYYFIKRRFPRRERRVEIRKLFNESRTIPDDILYNDEYFQDFNLSLPDIDNRKNKFSKLNYATLGDYQTQFNLRAIRNIIVKQVKPSNDDSSIYEIFSRLNTGGILLTPQEIRLSLYHSDFYDQIFQINLRDEWRALLGQPEPDLHMRDIETLLRAIAVWQIGADYKSSMVKFLNRFSREAKSYSERKLDSIYSGIDWFLSSTPRSTGSALRTGQSRFSVPLFESVFAAACTLHDSGKDVSITPEIVEKIKHDPDFQIHAREQTTHVSNVLGRRRRAMQILHNS